MLFLLVPHAYGTELIIDSSTSEVKVSSAFIGTNVMVFGTANDKNDIIVVITGPTETAIVRKKGRVSGIWINKEKLWGVYLNERFNVPFYQPLINQLWKLDFF